MSHKDDINFCNYWADLREYGIYNLTGEADAYGQRLLCDLNEDGVELLNAYFGGNLSFKENSNWNSSVNGKPAIASILLHRNMLMDLLVFILFFRHNKTYVHRFDYGNMTGTDDEHTVAEGSQRIVNHAKMSNMPQAGGRNVHAATGRVL